MGMVAEIGKTVLRQCPCQGVMNRQAAKSGIEDADVKMCQRKFSTGINSLLDCSICVCIIHWRFVETAKPAIRKPAGAATVSEGPTPGILRVNLQGQTEPVKWQIELGN